MCPRTKEQNELIRMQRRNKSWTSPRAPTSLRAEALIFAMSPARLVSVMARYTIITPTGIY